MVERTLRYAMVDLTNRTAEVQEVRVDAFGTWAMHGAEMAFWWESDPTAVALTTGVLTGVGAPGTGAMSWSYPAKSGKLQTIYAEGRLGAMMRCAGVDALVFYGNSKNQVCVTISEDGIVMEEKGLSYEELLAHKKHEDAVLVTISRRAVVEDKYFAIGDAAVAKALSGKGVGAIVVETEGFFAVENSAEVAEISVDLYQAAIRSGRLNPLAGRNTPAYYMSLDHTASFDANVSYSNPVADESMEVLAALGMIWSPALADRDAMETAAALVRAVTGNACTAADLEDLRAELAACKTKKVVGGAV